MMVKILIKYLLMLARVSNGNVSLKQHSYDLNQSTTKQRVKPIKLFYRTNNSYELCIEFYLR